MGTSLQTGVAAAKAGDKKSAMQYLRQAINENPRDINAWLWISKLVSGAKGAPLHINN